MFAGRVFVSYLNLSLVKSSGHDRCTLNDCVRGVIILVEAVEQRLNERAAFGGMLLSVYPLSRQSLGTVVLSRSSTFAVSWH